MKRTEQAYEQLRRANPVPDPATLLEELTTERNEGTRTMSTSPGDPKEPRTPKGRRGFIVGLSTTAVILILGVTAIFLTTREDQPTGDLSPVEMAEAYIDSRSDHDAELALDLVSNDFRTTESPDGYLDREGIELAFRSHEILGYEITEVTCRQSGERIARVDCQFFVSTDLHEAGGFDPTPTVFIFAMQDDLIVHIEEVARSTDWWDSFEGFVASQAPDFAQVLAQSMQLDREAIETVSEELPHYVDTYTDWVNIVSG